MWTDFVNETLLPSLLTILSAAVTALVGVAVAAVNKWAQKQKAQWVATVMTSLTEAAKRAVLKTNQVFVDDLRASLADGELGLEDQQAALALARNTMRDELSDELWEALLRIVGDQSTAERVMDSMIESQVKAVKNDAAATS